MFILKLVLRILAFFILIFSSLIFELISQFWDESSWIVITRIAFHTGVILLIFLLVKKYLLKYWSLKKSFVTYLSFCILFLSFLSIQTYYTDKRLGIKQFNYPIASCSEIGRGLLSNSFTTNSYNKISQILPFSSRYILLSGADACRVLQIKLKLNNIKTRELMCPGLSKADCMREVILETNLNSSYTITGKILLIAVSAVFAFEEKEKYIIKDHPLVNEEIKERGKILMALNSTISLLDLMSLLESTFISDKGVPGLFEDFPNEEIKKMPPELKMILARNLKEDVKKDASLEMYKMAAGMESKYSKMAEGIDPRVLDAYMIMLVDEEISGKLNKTSCSKLGGMYKTIFDKLYSDKYKKHLTTEELKSFDFKFKDFNKRRLYCRK